MIKIALFFSFSICLLVAARSSADDLSEAKEAFAEGSTFFSNGEYDEAAKAFRRANRLSPNWKLLYNIGQSEAAAKRHGLALQAFEEYLAEGGDEIPEPRRSEVAQEVERLRGIVGEIVVKAPQGAVIFVDDREVAVAPPPGPLPVSAGKLQQLRVELDGKIVFERQFRVGSGRTIEIDATGEEASREIEPSAPPEDEEMAPEEPAVPSEQPRRNGVVIGGWVLAGIGAAALVASAATGGAALKLDGELEDACPDGDCPPDRHDDVDRLGRLSIASDVLTGIGSAALATGAVMLVVSAVRAKKGREAQALSTGLAVGGHRIGVTLTGRF